MKRLLDFVRTTLIGGVLFLVPIVILAAVLGKAYSIAHGLAPAFMHAIDAVQLGHLLTPKAFAIVAIILFCFCRRRLFAHGRRQEHRRFPR